MKSLEPQGNYHSSEFSSGEMTNNVRLPQSKHEVKTKAQTLAKGKTEGIK